MTPSRDPAGNSNSSVEARASATLKRLAPLIGKVDAKHRRTSSYSTPNSDLRRQRRPVFGSGSRNGNGAALFEGRSRGGAHEDDGDVERLLRERVEGLALETERLRASRERAASLAAAEFGLDEAFLNSFGVSLNGTAGAGAGATPSFDREQVASLAATAEDSARASKAEEETRTARRQKAEATLSAAEFKCWEIREEIERYRRQEEKIRSQIFNGDPLLPLWGGPGSAGE